MATANDDASSSYTSYIPLSTRGDQNFLPSPQNSSKLLQLPAEIRLKILRLLHKAAQLLDLGNSVGIALEHLEYNSTCNADRSIFEFSGQVLACCQQLETKGSSILYGENRLAIKCAAAGSMNALHIHCLGAHIHFARCLRDHDEPDELHAFVEAHSTVQARHLISEVYQHDETWPAYLLIKNLQMYRFIKRFHCLTKIRKI